MFWRKCFIILLLAFFVIPKPVSAEDNSKKNACINLGCPDESACSAFTGDGVKNAEGNYYCLSTKCQNEDNCVFVDRKCNTDDDCTGYSTVDGGQKCLQNYCYLDLVGKENYDKGGTVGFTDVKVDLKIKEPKLMISIPGLIFSKLSSTTITQENGKTYLNIPYIAEYIAAAYKVGLVIMSIIAVVMIVVAGVKIIVGGGDGKAEGFQRIGQVMVGLFIGWGSFTILNIVNPNLVSFKALRVQYVDPIDEVQFAPETLTDKDLSEANKGPYDFQYFKSSDCPVQLGNDAVYNQEKPGKPGDIRQNVPRRLEFHDKIIPLITGSTDERILKAIEATTRCHIQYENCGVGSTNMYALVAQSGSSAAAGSYADKCLKNSNTGNSYRPPKTPNGFCNVLGSSAGNIKKTLVHNAYVKNIPSTLSGLWCGSKESCCKDDACKQKIEAKCVQDSTAASDKLKGILLSSTDWSPNWIDDLQPGDYYMIVNWNPSCQATHSAMFIKWKDKDLHIAWVEMADAANFLRIGTKNFNDKDLVIQISRPRD